MIVKEIQLKDFLSHQDTTIDFPLGVTLILGPNGAGKTSIIEGILFALYGDKERGNKVTDVIRKKADFAETTLTFQEGGRTYDIYRKRPKKDPEVKLEEEGNTIAINNEAVDNELESLFEMDKDKLVNSIFVKQGEISSLIEQSPRHRANFLGDLIGLNKIEDAWNKMGEVVKYFESQCKDLPVLQKDLENKTEQLSEKTSETSKTQKDITIKSEELKSLNIKLEAREKDIISIKLKQTKNTDLNADLISINKDIEATQKNMNNYETNIKEIEGARGDLEQLKEEIAKIPLLEQLSRIDSDGSQREAVLKSLNKELQIINKYLSIRDKTKNSHKKFETGEIDEKLTQIVKNKEDLEDEASKKKQRLSDIGDYIRILGESQECPVCNTVLTNDHRNEVRDDFESENIKINHRLQEIKVSLVKVKKSKKNFEEQKDKLKEESIKYKEALKSLENERSIELVNQELTQLESKSKSDSQSKEETIDKLGYTPKNIEIDLKNLRKKKETYEVLASKFGEIESIRSNIKQLKSELANFQSLKVVAEEKIKKLGYSDKIYKEVEKKHKDASNLVSSTISTIDNLNKSLQTDQKKITELRKKVSSLKGEIKDLEKVHSFANKLDEIRRLMHRDKIQREIRKNLAPVIAERALEYVENFNLDVIDISIDEKFEITIKKKEGKIPINSASGGEKVALSIAIRLAIAKILAGNISSIIMDEPTMHLDEERKKDLVKSMSNFLREGESVPQMIIVTHCPELEEIADTTYRIEKIDGVSRVKLEEY